MQVKHHMLFVLQEGAQMNIKIRRYVNIILMIIILFLPTDLALAEFSDPYSDYLNRLENIKTEQDIKKNGFTVIKKQTFFVDFENFGNVKFVPVIDKKHNRIALLFFNKRGHIVFKTEQIESNYWNKGEMKQPNLDIVAVSFLDMNYDGLKDVVIICNCVNQSGTYAGETYKIGEVLFQTGNGFYRDWRISDRMNRFSMNKDIPMITSFVRDGQSSEFLYTSSSMDQLLQNDFRLIKSQCFSVYLEKFGEVQVRPGIYQMAGRYIFMVFLIDSNGKILWNFEPINEYNILHELNALSFRDVNEDGLKDMIIYASYGKTGENGAAVIEYDVSIYHQGAGYFYEDIEFKKTLNDIQHETIYTITEKARKFWGEGMRNDKNSYSGR